MIPLEMTGTLFCLVFFSVGAILVYTQYKIYRKYKDETPFIAEGSAVSNRVVWGSNRKKTYYPIYAYEYKGKMHEVQANLNTSRPVKIGSKQNVYIYHDYITVEKVSMMGIISIVGYFFMLTGVLLLLYVF